MKVKDVMTKKVVTISPKLSIRVAAEEMKDNGVGCLVVTQGDDVVGIITEKHIIKVLADSKLRDAENITVGYAMEDDFDSASPDADIDYAIRRMNKKGVKKLPVLRGKKLVGILTTTDIVRRCPDIIKKHEHYR